MRAGEAAVPGDRGIDALAVGIDLDHDLGHQMADDFLAVLGRGGFGVPERRDVGGEPLDLGALLRGERDGFRLQEAVVVVGEFALATQGGVPVLFQRARHEAMLGIDRAITPLRVADLVGGALELLLPMTVEARAFALEVGDGLPTQFQCGRLQSVQDLFGQEIVERLGTQAMTNVRLEVKRVADAAVMRRALVQVTGPQPPAALGAVDEPGQQRFTVTRHAGAGHAGAIGVQPLLVGQVALPADVGREPVAQENIPVFVRLPVGRRVRHRFGGARHGSRTALAASAIGIGAGVDGTRQHVINEAERGATPLQLAGVRAGVRTVADP